MNPKTTQAYNVLPWKSLQLSSLFKNQCSNDKAYKGETSSPAQYAAHPLLSFLPTQFPNKDNFVLSYELIMQIGHCKELWLTKGYCLKHQLKKLLIVAINISIQLKKDKLSCNIPHGCSTTVSLKIYFLYSRQRICLQNDSNEPSARCLG